MTETYHLRDGLKIEAWPDPHSDGFHVSMTRETFNTILSRLEGLIQDERLDGDAVLNDYMRKRYDPLTARPVEQAVYELCRRAVR